MFNDVFSGLLGLIGIFLIITAVTGSLIPMLLQAGIILPGMQGVETGTPVGTVPGGPPLPLSSIQQQQQPTQLRSV